MEAAGTKKFPDLKWAQRKDRLFVTIDLPDVESPQISLKPEGKLMFEGKVKAAEYHIDLDLFKEVVVEESRWNLKGRNILLNIVKKDKDDEYWLRLTREKVKHPHIKVDWTRWIEEEDEHAAGGFGAGDDFDPDNMNDFGAGDYNDSDDDEEEVEAQADAEANADLDDMDAELEANNADNLPNEAS